MLPAISCKLQSPFGVRNLSIDRIEPLIHLSEARCYLAILIAQVVPSDEQLIEFVDLFRGQLACAQDFQEGSRGHALARLSKLSTPKVRDRGFIDGERLGNRGKGVTGRAALERVGTLEG